MQSVNVPPRSIQKCHRKVTVQSFPRFAANGYLFPLLGPSLPARPDLDPGPTYDVVSVQPDPNGLPLPDASGDPIVVDAIHDGNGIPAEFLSHAPDDPWHILQKAYAAQRDWGASLLAGALASALHLRGFFRVNTARVLMDFGRFPGVTPAWADGAEPCAIRAPFDHWLTHAQQRSLLDRHYDVLAGAMARAVDGRRVKVAIHTFDGQEARNRTRSPVGLVTKVMRFSSNEPGPGSHPLGPFDPLFPSELFDCTADRLLRARLTLTLEEHGWSVDPGDPEPMSLGSVEARTLVRRYFKRLQGLFEEHHPVTDSARAEARARVWAMLTDTGLRSADAALLRSVIHQLRQPPAEHRTPCELAFREYGLIREHLLDHLDDWMEQMRAPADRTHVLAVHVRQDLLWNRVDGPFGSPRHEGARDLGRILAKGIRCWFTEDRPEVMASFNRRSGHTALRTVGE